MAEEGAVIIGPSERVHAGQEDAEAEQARQSRDDPEADGDLLLGPSDELEVVMQRSHAEDAAAAELVAADLEHDAHDDREEDDPDDSQQRQLAVDGGDHGERGPEAEGPRVAHE